MEGEKRHRKRKKRLLNAIREQIEFYFSDANLRHDRFMRQLIGANDQQELGRRSVDLQEFLKFNKITSLTQNVRDIQLALQKSQCLTVDPQLNRCQRVDPYVNKDVDVDDATIYVERLPPTADHQWLRSVFEPFGRIQYLKLPLFRHNHMIMGFAFVEYEDKLSAQKALKHFNALSSLDTESDQQLDTNTNDTDADCAVAESVDKPEDSVKLEVSLKRSHDATDDECSDAKRPKVVETDNCAESCEQIVSKNSETIDEKISNKTKDKKKKRRKKRNLMSTEVVEESPPPEAINLRVMSKKEWKQWKNKYLKLQKQTMSSLKRSLLVKTEDNKSQQMNSESTKEDNNNNDRTFESGLIIKLNFTVSSLDFNDNEFKRKIRLMAQNREISYIDLPKNQMEFKDSETIGGICYIRTNSVDDCQRLLQLEKLKQMGDLSVLSGSTETDYWNQIFDERSKKKANNNNCHQNKSKHKARGFDRIISRAENAMTNVNKHIKFDN